MSSIDQYEHELLDFIECPSADDFVDGNPTRKIAIYRLKQNIPGDETHFDGKAGDILLGGGSGEAEALRISYPEAVHFFKNEGWNHFQSYDQILKAYWSPSFSYKIGNGFRKIGWNPESRLEWWVAEQVLDILLQKGLISIENPRKDRK